jgi:predicted HTH domain antitoxin
MIMHELVLRLYQDQIISSVHGAFLFKMNRTEFERFISSESIPFHCNPEELDQDISDIENAV